MHRKNSHLFFPAIAGVLLSLFVLPTPLLAQTIAESFPIYSSRSATPFHTSVWNMKMTTAPGGIHPRGSCLWFNTDWQAKPWAGLRFTAKNAPSLKLTKQWVDNGFIRLFINVTVDRYGNIGGGGSYQILPQTDNKKTSYQEIRSQYIDKGRGIDENPSTWQEILIPLKYFTELKPGNTLMGLNFQTRHQAERTFSLDAIEYVRFDTPPAWITEQLNATVKQEWVTWPAYDELPDVVKADRHPISIRDGKFITPDGSRAFLLNPYCREDCRLVYGNKDPANLPPTHDLYDRKKHGWIYDETPTTEYLCRLGFNSYSVTPVPVAWWRSVNYQGRYGAGDDAFLSTLTKQITLPYFVDLVAWPYTMGTPGLNTDDCDLPDSAATIGRNHWTQYRTIGAGRKAWLDMWQINAKRYRDSGAKTLIIELLNEPAYMGESPDHYAEFEQWLKQRYGSVEEINRIWGSTYKSIAEASVYKFSDGNKTPDGQRLDYDEYLSEAFEDLISAGISSVNEILPGSLSGVQTMRGYMSTPHESVWKYKLARIESVVLTPTGGGGWTSGSAASKPSQSITTHPMAGAPLENDLLLAVSGDKMIVDNETYLRGQTRLDTRNRLWEHVVCGLDGLTVFAWSKRGWVWWKDRAKVQTDADKYPYSSLIPIARRTDALRGILDFSIEVQTLAPEILPKPWGPEPSIGILYSWDNARRRLVDENLYNKLPAYYAAMRNTHWNMCMLTADSVLVDGIPENIEVVVAGGLTHVEPKLSAAISTFVKRGGTLILGECDFTTDIYNRPLPDSCRLAPVTVSGINKTSSTIKLNSSSPLFPGTVTAVATQKTTPLSNAEIILKGSNGNAVVTRGTLGKGNIYYQAADLFGYPLAATLYETLYHACGGRVPDNWRSVNITEEGHHAPNIIASRRSHPNRHSILLLNRDSYDRTVTLSIPGLTGEWTVTDALTKTKAQPMPPKGITVKLPASGPAVLLLERR